MVNSSWQRHRFYHELLCTINCIGDVCGPTVAGHYAAESFSPGMFLQVAEQSWRSSMIKDFDREAKLRLKNASSRTRVKLSWHRKYPRMCQIIVWTQIPAPAPFHHIRTSTHFPNKSPLSHPIIYCSTLPLVAKYAMRSTQIAFVGMASAGLVKHAEAMDQHAQAMGFEGSVSA